MIFWFICVVLLCAFIAVRALPTDPDKWHVAVTANADKDMAGGAIRILTAAPDALARLDKIAMETPRTTKIAGDVAQGRITYQTRSKWIGFPDFTTVEVSDGSLRMLARLRFGHRDFGVNRARLEKWIAQLN